MKRQTISEAVGKINEKYIVEASDISVLKKGNAKIFKRIVSIAAAAAICMSVSVTVMAAADVEPAYELLYNISPQIAQSLKPIRMSCEDNGIKMEVISAEVTDNKAYIYVSMQDLTGDRIDETVDLYDSYNINCPFDQVGTCNFVKYDKDSKTCTFLIEISTMNGENMDGEKITFSIGEFLSHKQEIENMKLDLDLSIASLDPKIQTDIDVRGGNSIKSNMLLSNGKLFEIEKGASVTAMGFVDGKLHVQVYYEDILITDNHGFVYLLDENGNELYPYDETIFWDNDRKGSYQEYIFDITPEQAENYKIYGDFCLCDTLTKGDWEVTFKLN